MKKFFLILLSVLSFTTFADNTEKRSARVEFSSLPEGAKVFVNDVLRGNTPLTLFDIPLGACHVRFELANYEAKDEFFDLTEGAYISKHAELIPLKGLLLLTTDPEGATVMIDGLSLGETPRLITTLDATKKHRLLLQKAGYQSRNVDIKFDGRTPLVKHENLILDSGALEITTEPEGATVMVNGIVRGRAPLSVSDIPKGTATVVVKLNGYKEVTRELTFNPGSSQKLLLKLEGIPGVLNLTSIPEGARFYINNLPQGKGPISLKNVKPGNYTIRAEADGCEVVSREVTVSNGATVSEEFRLDSNLGSLEVRTLPAEIQVFVDGKIKGTTKQARGSTVSDVLAIKNLVEGEHTVILKANGYADTVKRMKIERKKATILEVKMKRAFTPNVKVQTLTGTYTGVLVNNGAELVVVEISPGVVRSFPKVDLKKIEFLAEDLK